MYNNARRLLLRLDISSLLAQVILYFKRGGALHRPSFSNLPPTLVTPVSVGLRARPPDSKQSDGTTVELKNVRVHRLLCFCPSVILALYLVPPFATKRVTGLLASACKSSERRLICLLRNSKLPCLYRSKGRQKKMSSALSTRTPLCAADSESSAALVEDIQSQSVQASM